jgi:hypothetical protein
MAKNQAKVCGVVEKVPTFEHALSIFAYHIGAIMAPSPENRVRVHFYGGVSGDYTFIRDNGAVSAGDTCEVNGKRFGCRTAARNDYTERCAPILAKILAGTYTAE